MYWHGHLPKNKQKWQQNKQKKQRTEYIIKYPWT